MGRRSSLTIQTAETRGLERGESIEKGSNTPDEREAFEKGAIKGVGDLHQVGRDPNLTPSDSWSMTAEFNRRFSKSLFLKEKEADAEMG